jgi:uncharacterized damage-inducible protein DinB
MKDYFKQLFQYDKWANECLLDKFEHQFPLNQRIYELFSHMLSAERVWLDRVLGLPQSVAVWAERLPEEIKEDTENYNAGWLDFIDSLAPDDFEKNVHYVNSQGNAFDMRLVDIITHVINHGTHHRGNIIILMKEEGYVLPDIDFFIYVNTPKA